MKNKNTYENSNITDSGAKEHMSGLHQKCISTNQYVWDMMKILKKEEMFGFHFEAKVGAKKILIILHHEDKKKLEEAQNILQHISKDDDVLFLTKLKKKKQYTKQWIIAFSLIFLTILISFFLNFFYKKGYLDSIIGKSDEISQALIKESNYPKYKEKKL